MTFPPDFPMKRFLWGFFPWYILLAYCLLNLFYGYYWEAFIRLVEWTLALGPYTYFHSKSFLKWGGYSEEEKKELLHVSNAHEYFNQTKQQIFSGLCVIFWIMAVFAFFRWLHI